MMRHRVLAFLLMLSTVAFGVMPAHAARTVGQIIDDAGITTSVRAKIAADRFANLFKIDVRTFEGVVTLNGTVDTPERRDRIGQLASWTNGVKNVVNNIQVSGSESAPSQTTSEPQTPTTTASTPMSSPNLSSTSPIDVTGSVATVDPGTGALTLSDGRVVRVTDTSTIWQPSTVQSLQPGTQVLIRNGAAAGVESSAARTGEWRMGTVSRVDHIDNQIILTDGTVVKVTPSTTLRKGTEPLTFDKLQPGWEIVVKAPNAPVVDASQIDVVWAPTASAMNGAPAGSALPPAR
jgi:hyperosmotically inducible periplasmic protein